jgi:hypothetical protein
MLNQMRCEWPCILYFLSRSRQPQILPKPARLKSGVDVQIGVGVHVVNSPVISASYPVAIRGALPRCRA